jgi:hypothetical protein
VNSGGCSDRDKSIAPILYSRVSYVEYGRIIARHKTLIISARMIAPHRLGSQDRGDGAD